MKNNLLIFITSKNLEKERIKLVEYLNERKDINKKIINIIDLAIITYNYKLIETYKIK